jgi:predicted RNase H-like nuclease (RuvC/YqgF family)
MNHVDELIATLACKRHEEYELNKKLDHLDGELRSLGWVHDEAMPLNKDVCVENMELRQEISERKKENAELRMENEKRKEMEQQLNNRLAKLEAMITPML